MCANSVFNSWRPHSSSSRRRQRKNYRPKIKERSVFGTWAARSKHYLLLSHLLNVIINVSQLSRNEVQGLKSSWNSSPTTTSPPKSVEFYPLPLVVTYTTGIDHLSRRKSWLLLLLFLYLNEQQAKRERTKNQQVIITSAGRVPPSAIWEGGEKRCRPSAPPKVNRTSPGIHT